MQNSFIIDLYISYIILVEMSGTQDIDEEPQVKADPWGKLVSLNKSKANNFDLNVFEVTYFFEVGHCG